MHYRALRTISVIFKVLGWITVVFGVLSSCGTAAMAAFGGLASLSTIGGGSTDSSATASLLGGGAATVIVAIVMVLVGLIFTAIYALLLFAAAEGISVFLNIESNTREMAERLRG